MTPDLIDDYHTRDNTFILRTAGKHSEQSPARGLTEALLHSEPLGLLFKECLRGFKEPTSLLFQNVTVLFKFEKKQEHKLYVSTRIKNNSRQKETGPQQVTVTHTKNATCS